MTRALTRHTLGVPAPLWWIIRSVQRTQRPPRAAGCVVRAATDPALAQCTGQLTRGKHQTRPIPTDPTVAAEALIAARRLTATSRGGTFRSAADAPSTVTATPPVRRSADVR